FFETIYVSAQDNRPRQRMPVAFGVQVSPIVPSSLFRIRAQSFTDNNGFDVSVAPRAGYSANALIQFGISKKFTLHTGLGLIRRNFLIDATVDSMNLKDLRMRIINYEIPIAATYYVNLGKNFLMCNSIGTAMNFPVSNLTSFNEDVFQF